MFEGYVTALLLRYGRKFIQDLPDLKLSLWGGDVELNQLKLRVDAIERVFPGSGIFIKQGILEHLSLNIPWTSLTSSPIVITLDGLKLTALATEANALPLWVKEALSSSQSTQGDKMDTNITKPETSSEAKEEGGWGGWMIRKISNNITLHIKNLHVTLQHNDKLCTLHVEDIKVTSTNHFWEESFVEPGKFNFLRKACHVQGVHLTVNDCDYMGEEKVHIEPIVQQTDFVVRVAMILDRFSPSLPDNRIDLLFLTPLSLHLTAEQYRALLQIIRRLLRHKSKEKSIKPPTKVAASPVPTTHPTTSQESTKTQKGWLTWVVNTLTEEDEATPEKERFSSATIISAFSLNCNLRINKENSVTNLFSFGGKRWAFELILNSLDGRKPFVKLGMESVVMYARHDVSNTNPLEILQANSTTLSSSGSPARRQKDSADFFDYTPCIAGSLFDRRKTVRYAIDLLNEPLGLQELKKHEFAFGRFSADAPVASSHAQYLQDWKSFNGLLLSIYSRSEGKPGLVDFELSPKLAVLDISFMKEIVSFFTPTKDNIDTKEFSEEVKEDKKGIAEDLSISLEKILLSFWTHTAPTQIRVTVAPSRLYISPISKVGESQVSRDIMVFVDHLGISFSNSAPNPQQLLANPLYYQHDIYTLSLSTSVVGMAVRNRSGHFSSDVTRSFCKSPFDMSISFGAPVCSRVSKLFRADFKSLQMELSHSDMILFLAWLPIPLISRSIIQEAERELLNIPEKHIQPTGLIDYDNILSICSQGGYFEYRGSQNGKIPSLECSLLFTDFSFLNQRNDQSFLIFRVGSQTSTSPLTLKVMAGSFEVALSDCELFLLTKPLCHWIAPACSLKPQKSTSIAPVEKESPMRKKWGAKKSEKSFQEKMRSLHLTTVSVRLENIIIHLADELESKEMFCLVLPEVTALHPAQQHPTWTASFHDAHILLEHPEDASMNESVTKHFSIEATCALSEEDTSISLYIKANPVCLRFTSPLVLRSTKLLSLMKRRVEELFTSSRFHKEPVPRREGRQISMVRSSSLLVQDGSKRMPNTKEKGADAFSIVERSLTATENIQCEISFVFPSVTVMVDDYSLSADDISLLLISKHPTPQEPHTLSFHFIIASLCISSHVSHRLLDLVDRNLLCSSPAPVRPLFSFGWTVRQSLNILAIGHDIVISIGSFQGLLWMPALLDIFLLLSRLHEAYRITIPSSSSIHKRSRSWNRSTSPEQSDDAFSLRLRSTAGFHSISMGVNISDIRLLFPASYSKEKSDLVLFTWKKFSFSVASHQEQRDASIGWIWNERILPITTLECSLVQLHLYAGTLSAAPSSHSLLPSSPIPTWLTSCLIKPVDFSFKSAPDLHSWTLYHVEGFASSIHFSFSNMQLHLLVATVLSLQAYVRLLTLLVSTSISRQGGMANSSLHTQNTILEMEQLPPLKKEESAREAKGTSFALSFSLPSVELHFREENKDLLFSQILETSITVESGFPFRVEGKIQNILLLSEGEERFFELVKRNSSNHSTSPKTPKPLPIFHVSSEWLENEATRILFHFAPIHFALHASLANRLYKYSKLSFISFPKVWRKETSLEVLRRCKPARPPPATQPTIKHPIICTVITSPWSFCLSAYSDWEDRKNSILYASLPKLHFIYSPGHQDATLSFSCLQISLGSCLSKLSPIFRPSVEGKLSLLNEIHNASFYKKRVAIIHINIPLIHLTITAEQIPLLLNLFRSFSLPTSSNHPYTTKPSSLSHDESEDPILMTVSSGSLREEGLSLLSTRNVRPEPNSVTVSSLEETNHQKEPSEGHVDLSPCKWMAWKYTEPRSIREIIIQPLPSLEEGRTVVAESSEFEFLYFNEIQQKYISICSWKVQLQSSGILRLGMPKAGKECISAKEFQIISRHFPLPSTALPITVLIPSYYIPQFSHRLLLHAHCQQGKVNLFSGTEEFCSLSLQDSKFHLGLRGKQIEVGWCAHTSLQYVESRFLTSQTFLEATHLECFLSYHTKSEKEISFSFNALSAIHLNISPAFLRLAQTLHSTLPTLLSADPQRIESAFMNRHYQFMNRTNQSLFIGQCHSDYHGTSKRLLPFHPTWYSWDLVPKHGIPMMSISSHSTGVEWSLPFSIDVLGWNVVHLDLQSSPSSCWIHVSLRKNIHTGSTFTCIHLLGSCVFENFSRQNLQFHVTELQPSGELHQPSTYTPTLFFVPDKQEESTASRLDIAMSFFVPTSSSLHFYCTVDDESTGTNWQWTKEGIEIPSAGTWAQESEKFPKVCQFAVAQTGTNLCHLFLYSMFSFYESDKRGPPCIRFSPLLELQNFLPSSVQLSLLTDDPDMLHDTIIMKASSLDVSAPIYSPCMPFESDSPFLLHVEEQSLSISLLDDELIQSSIEIIEKMLGEQEMNWEEDRKEIILRSKQSGQLLLRWFLLFPTRSTSYYMPILRLGITWQFRISNWTREEVVLCQNVPSGSLCREYSPDQCSFMYLESPKDKKDSITFFIGIQPPVEEIEQNEEIIYSSLLFKLAGSGIPKRFFIGTPGSGSNFYCVVAKIKKFIGCYELIVSNAHYISNHSNSSLLLSFSASCKHPYLLAPQESISTAGPWNAQKPFCRLAYDAASIEQLEGVLSHWTPPLSLLPAELMKRAFINLSYEYTAILHSKPSSAIHADSLTFSTCNNDETLHMVLFDNKQAPLMVTNKTENFILSILPSTTSSSLFLPFSIQPNNKTSFALPYEKENEGKRIIGAKIRTKGNIPSCCLDVDVDLSDKKNLLFRITEDRTIRLAWSSIGESTRITLSEENAVSPSSPLSKNIRCSLKIASIGISIIDDRPLIYPKWQEIIQFFVDGAEIVFLQEKRFLSLHFTLEHYQIDNPLCKTSKRILFQDQRKEQERKGKKAADGFLILQRCPENSILHITCLSISLAPIYLSIEDKYGYRVLETAKTFSDLLFPSSCLPPSPSTSEMTNQLSKKQIENMTSNIIYIESLNMGEIFISLSAKFSAGIFLSLDRTPIYYPELIMNSKAFTVSELAVVLTERYVTSMFLEIPQIVASLELLGNPGHLVREFSTAIYQLVWFPLQGASVGGSSFISGIFLGFRAAFHHSSQGTFSSLYSFSSSMGRNFDALTCDREYQAYRESEREFSSESDRVGVQLLYGMKGFTYGVASGLFGVVSQPVAGAYGKGVLGFFEGLGKGVLGAVAKPIGGAADLISCTSQAVLQSMTGAMVIRRLGFPSSCLFVPSHDLGVAPHYSTSWVVAHISSTLKDCSICFTCVACFNEKACLLVVSLTHFYLLPFFALQKRKLEHFVQLELCEVFSLRLFKENVRLETFQENKLFEFSIMDPALRGVFAQLTNNLSRNIKLNQVEPN